MEKITYSRAGKKKGYRHTLKICYIYIFSTATMVIRKRLRVTLHTHTHTHTHIAFLSLCLLRDISASKVYKLSNIALFALPFYACPTLNAYKTEHVQTK